MNVSFSLADKTYSVTFSGFTSGDLQSFLTAHGASTIEARELAKNAQDLAQRVRQASRQVIKREAIDGERVIVTQLLEQHCISSPGNRLLFADVFKKLSPQGWSRQKFIKALAPHLKPISGAKNKKFILGLEWRSI